MVRYNRQDAFGRVFPFSGSSFGQVAGVPSGAPVSLCGTISNGLRHRLPFPSWPRSGMERGLLVSAGLCRFRVIPLLRLEHFVSPQVGEVRGLDRCVML